MLIRHAGRCSSRLLSTSIVRKESTLYVLTIPAACSGHQCVRVFEPPTVSLSRAVRVAAAVGASGHELELDGSCACVGFDYEHVCRRISLSRIPCGHEPLRRGARLDVAPAAVATSASGATLWHDVDVNSACDVEPCERGSLIARILGIWFSS